MEILVKDIVKSETAISYDDGKECLRLVVEGLEKEGNVTLNFDGIRFVITAFLNPVIGDLIIQQGQDVMKKIQITNINEDIAEKIKIVRNGALIKREDI